MLVSSADSVAAILSERCLCNLTKRGGGGGGEEGNEEGSLDAITHTAPSDHQLLQALPPPITIVSTRSLHKSSRRLNSSSQRGNIGYRLFIEVNETN